MVLISIQKRSDAETLVLMKVSVSHRFSAKYRINKNNEHQSGAGFIGSGKRQERMRRAFRKREEDELHNNCTTTTRERNASGVRFVGQNWGRMECM